MNIDFEAMADDLVDTFLGYRIESAGDPPGLRETTIAIAAAALGGKDAEQLIQQQIEQLRNPSSDAIPDAYLADEATAEDALQHAAAGMRAAAAQNGMILDPRSFERAAARRLGGNPRLAVRAEMARVPRPTARPEALRWSHEPVPWFHERDEDDAWPPPGLDATDSRRSLPDGPSALARIEGGPHSGWVQIGMIERHHTPARRYPARPGRMVLIGLGLEMTDREPSAKSLPFTSSPWQVWTIPWQRLDPTGTASDAVAQLATINSPMVALANDGLDQRGPRRSGLGDPRFLLVPVLPLVVALGLQPTPEICGFSFSDNDGPGLMGRLWRGHLIHDGNYKPLEPAVEGADLILRPDLFAQLLDIARESRVRVGIAAMSRSDDEDGDDNDD